MENIYAERIGAIRNFMKERGIDAMVISGSDPHSSEYPAARWKQVEWVCGFTGEAGDVVITLDHAGLWTDTRYFIQAVEQLAGTGADHRLQRAAGGGHPAGARCADPSAGAQRGQPVHRVLRRLPCKILI